MGMKAYYVSSRDLRVRSLYAIRIRLLQEILSRTLLWRVYVALHTRIMECEIESLLRGWWSDISFHDE